MTKLIITDISVLLLLVIMLTAQVHVSQGKSTHHVGADCPVNHDDCNEGYHANAFYQSSECKCVCLRNGRREVPTDIGIVNHHKPETNVVKSLVRRDNDPGSCSSHYSWFGADCPVNHDDCNEGYHANAFYQNSECKCVCLRNGRREVPADIGIVDHRKPETNVVKSSNLVRRDNDPGSCSSHYSWYGADCPVNHDDCNEGYHANAFYQSSECKCVCLRNGRREFSTDTGNYRKPEKKVVKTLARRDNDPGSCSSHYNWSGADCPVNHDDCNEGYHANAFYQSSEYKCVCLRNGRREFSTDTGNYRKPEKKVVKALARRDNDPGSCSSHYNWSGADCPVNHDDCNQGYHANAFYQSSE
eukprot:Awhi_evm1s11161